MNAAAPMSRARFLREGSEEGSCVLYWMSRDQRAMDNPALELAALRADDLGLPLLVCFCLAPGFLGATERQYGFMLKGLQEAEWRLSSRGIGFRLLLGDPGKEVGGLVAAEEAALLLTDLDPLRVKMGWKREVVRGPGPPVMEVDAHNIVPCWVASDKKEYSAATFRPKVSRALPSFLTQPLPMPGPMVPWREDGGTDWERARRWLSADRSVPELAWARPGERAAGEALRSFIVERLPGYHERRNDPNLDGQSGLSPYLHFGQISPRRVAWEVMAAPAPEADKAAFMEELVVRRELSDNFCLHEPDYDQVAGFPKWARESLDQHRSDRREHLYREPELERADTHDPLWNAAQAEMVAHGKMHGYLRMYWAKKLLEWCEAPEEAMRIAVRLNDRYELDGRDPNGYAGIAWSIGGVHDRAWPSRPVFGKVRYMSLAGARSKFDVDAYVSRMAGK